MVEVMRMPVKDLITIRASRKLSEADYERAIPEIEAAIKEAGCTINAVIEMVGVAGIELGALCKDLKFDIRHFDAFRRIAVVRLISAQEIGGKTATLLTNAKVDFFDANAFDEARKWAMGG